MKIIHLLNTGKFSGAENVVCQIIDLMKAENECVYCSRDGSIRNVLHKKNISFEPIKTMSVREVKRVIKKIHPDIIHAHDMRASFFAAMACGSTPLICHIHNNAYDARRINIKSISFFFAAIKAKHIFWVSQTSFSGYLFHTFFSKKSSILLNVINVEKLYEKMNEDSLSYSYDIIYVGRLTYQKNPERLIEILKDLRASLPNYKAAIVGDGPLKEKVIGLIKKYKLEQNITVLGFLQNPLKILRDSKIMLLVSRWEGLPMCVLEALALGTPVVSTPTDGIDCIIKDGENGFICRTNAEVEKNIVNLLKNAEMYSKIAKEALQFGITYNNLAEYKKRINLVYLSNFK